MLIIDQGSVEEESSFTNQSNLLRVSLYSASIVNASLTTKAFSSFSSFEILEKKIPKFYAEVNSYCREAL